MSQLVAPSQSNLVAPNQFVTAANDVTFAYRRFGNADAGNLPLVCFQHYRGNLDNWDPALVDAIARQREVILFDNAGVGGSTGVVPRTVTPMAYDALAFIEALDLREIDILGYSMGGFVAQELTLIRPRLVRRLVLAGTAPQGGPELHGYHDEVYGNAIADEPGADDLLALFFERSQTSIDKGQEFIQRIFTRTDGRDAPTTPEADKEQKRSITWPQPHPPSTQPKLTPRSDRSRSMCPRPTWSTSSDASPRRGGPARSSSQTDRRACSWR